jgi:hypothetical protein
VSISLSTMRGWNVGHRQWYTFFAYPSRLLIIVYSSRTMILQLLISPQIIASLIPSQSRFLPSFNVDSSCKMRSQHLHLRLLSSIYQLAMPSWIYSDLVHQLLSLLHLLRLPFPQTKARCYLALLAFQVRICRLTDSVNPLVCNQASEKN